MNEVDVIREHTAEQLRLFGEPVQLRRAGTADLTVVARITGYKPSELGGGIRQGDRKAVLLAQGVTFDPPLRPLDKLILRGRILNIEIVDDSTRRAGGELIAYELTVRG